MRIAFAGQMRSGKDAAAEYAIKTLGGQVCKFADALYLIHDHAISPGATVKSTMSMAEDVMGPHLTPEELHNEDGVWFPLWLFVTQWFRPVDSYPYDGQGFKQRRVEGEKSRYFLQWLGTEWARCQIHPDIWVRIFLKNLTKLDPAQHIFCTDLRFHNECKALRENGFVSIRVERPEQDRVAAGASLMAHPSEVDVPFLDVDLTIYNRSTLEDYYAQLDLLFNSGLLEQIRQRN
jgi:hypothetical protein